MARALFPELPETFDGVSDADLAPLHEQFLEASDQIAAAAQKDATPEAFAFVEGVDNVHEQMLAGVEAALSIKAEIDAREQVASEQRDSIAELAAKTELAAETETVEETVEEPVVAAATPARRPRGLPRPSAAHQPLQVEHELAVVASTDIPAFRPGQRLERKTDIATAMLRAIRERLDVHT